MSNRIALFTFATLALACAASTALAQSTISTVAGNGSAGNPVDGSVATASPLNGPTSIAIIPGGGFYIGDIGGVRKVDSSGIITTVAATLPTQVDGLALAPDGSLYFSVETGHIVNKRAPNGTVTTIVGTGVPSSTGDGGPAIDATLNSPTGLGLDAAGNLYIAEYEGCRVRKVNTVGIISTLIGTGTCSSTGDGGLASNATVSVPWGVLVNNVTGSVFITEYGGARIRQIASNGIVSTFAGNGTTASLGDGGQATAASLGGPLNMDVDAAGNFYVAEFLTNHVRRIAPNGVISTVAGTGSLGVSGDGGPAVNAAIGRPYTFATASGGYYIAQRDDLRVRFVADATIQPQDPDPEPSTTCASEGYKGAKLTWCKNICENGLTGQVLDTWIHRWIRQYRQLPYCAVEGGEGGMG